MEDFATLNFDISPTGSSRLSQVDFENLAFGQVFSDHMFVMDYENGEWQRGEISLWPHDFLASDDVLALRSGDF